MLSPPTGRSHRAPLDPARGQPGRRRRLLFCADGGFTLIEVMVAAVVLLAGVLALFGTLDSSVRAIASTRAREGATNLARTILEDAHTVPYAQVSPSSIEPELQAMAGLADASPAAGWQVIRNGVTYTITASECAIDDPKDGWGKHVIAGQNPFCKDPGEQEGSEDSQPEDLKRITVDVRWTALGRAPDVHQVTTLSAAGESVGLSASALTLASPHFGPASAPLVTSEPSSKELQFTVSSPKGTAALVWSVDGKRQAKPAIAESTTTWSFSWPIGALSDGSYVITAQAVNALGVTGPPISLSVILIRGAPTAPKSIVGGFNTVSVGGKATRVVELQWQANAERNVIGYRVYRPVGSGRELACPAGMEVLSVSTSCTDFSPPSPKAANLTYQVVALFRQAQGEALSSEVSESPAATFAVTGGEPLPPGPNPPRGPLVLEHLADGSVSLKWSEPASGGPPVSFYRIYRGSSDYAGRYDITGSGSTTTYNDSDATVTHSYWVTAVGANLTESTPIGPVTG